MAERLVSCEEHGELPGGFVCQHVFSGERLGFHQGQDEDGEPSLEGWCNRCENLRALGKGWNDDNMAFADIKLVCSACFERIKTLNQLKRP
ncbi:hypothetical protein [Spirosoma litoris]